MVLTPNEGVVAAATLDYAFFQNRGDQFADGVVVNWE